MLVWLASLTCFYTILRTHHPTTRTHDLYDTQNRLGQEGDKDRLLQLYEAMEPQLGVPRTAR